MTSLERMDKNTCMQQCQLRCGICGSTKHGYKRHYPAPSDRLYKKLRELWIDFLNVEITAIYDEEDMSFEEGHDYYDELVDKFCEKNKYSQGLQEMSFYDYWLDTFKDIFWKVLRGDSFVD